MKLVQIPDAAHAALKLRAAELSAERGVFIPMHRVLSAILEPPRSKYDELITRGFVPLPAYNSTH